MFNIRTTQLRNIQAFSQIRERPLELNLLSETVVPSLTSTIVLDTVYKSFYFDDGYAMTAYVGRNIVLQLPRNKYKIKKETIDYIVYTLDAAYDYYYSVIGEYPASHITVEGKDTISVVNRTCGSGCGLVGHTGIELLSSSWERLYNGVVQNDEFDQVLFYELGRNFFVNSLQKIECNTPNFTIGTGFAVFMRFMSMEQIGIKGGPFKGYLFAEFKQHVKNLLGVYLQDPTYTWMNSIYEGVGPKDTDFNYKGFGPKTDMNLGATDLWASFMFGLDSRFPETFSKNIWKQIKMIDHTVLENTGDLIAYAIDVFVLAASKATSYNLYDFFTKIYGWPVSSNLKQHRLLNDLKYYPALGSMKKN